MTLAISAASVYAETCATTEEIKFQSDGYFVTASGWRSEASYPDLKNPVPVLQSVSYAKDAQGATRFKGCRYGIEKDGGIELMTMLPVVITPVVKLGKNWQQFPHTGGYTCMSQSSEDSCNFIIGTEEEEAVISPFGHKP